MNSTHPILEKLIQQITSVILGKEQQIRLVLTCLLARGHVLIEDLPGVGKTTLAHALAKAMGVSFQRIQFTSDLLPADIIGVSIFDKNSAEFKFHIGPIFAQMVLADEVNRATPKTQSALLEAMEEHQVTVDGVSHVLPSPFFVLATQNPLHQIGTFPLPESQLDRFMMCLALGYPDARTERDLLRGQDRRDLIEKIQPVIALDEFVALQKNVPQIHVSDATLDYIQALLAYSRESPRYRYGLSPRAGLALLHSGQAWALLHGRDYVLPEDIQTILPGVVTHRLVSSLELREGQSIVDPLLTEVAIP
ncbi:AAA family ATPase [Thioflexithrix psekupsensis]|uniref:AAA family ATPase n=1 Tax=Thioflexithrix psekupsensis TaxID=1570016 RepID=A0A251X3K1_9GAMM|nr:MoxR family ATPase [Thioflexithrix psekupsensis]OUD11717.1 AAA family ATPase [Thioflexithrix psekupsensis]